MNTYKLLLLGEGGVGKSTYIRRLLTGQFEKSYIATLGVEVHPLRFNTNYGPICFNVWDCAGTEKYGGLRDGYFIQGACCIIMFDLTSNISFKNTLKWLRDYRRVVKKGPIILCGNKCDIERRVVKNADINKLICELGLEYWEISSKSNNNFEKPFLSLAKKLMNKEDLQFR